MVPQPTAALAARAAAFIAFFFAATVGQRSAVAGGGPENVFLVVNAKSQNSLTVANNYIRLRRIPPGNVCYLEWDFKSEATDVETFRQKILIPALTAISARALANQIDYLIYSSDFPTRIDFVGDMPEDHKKESFLSASLTGLTYLHQYTLARVPQLYMGFTSNRYTRTDSIRTSATHGFRSWYGWGSRGELLETGGNHYLLSTMLAVTSPRGNTVPEALSYLRRAAEADGTSPKGTIFYMANSNVRSTTRQPKFDAAVAELKKLGIAATIEDGVVPQRKSDVAGAMMGYSVAPWADSRSKILPGAIVENLTSFGGVFGEGTGQTVLSDYLRFGAAGSSGAVVEPYANPFKFPAPAIQVHYGRGCSLAEAFYQSVSGPYQLLIVGDPLCRPWASIPEVKVDGVERGATVRGTIELKPTARSPGGRTIDRFELFVNGMRIDHCAGGGTFKLDTEQVADGYSELRIVAIEAGRIETQGEVTLPIFVDNHGRTIDASASAAKVAAGKPLAIRASAHMMDEIAVYQQSQLLGTIAGEKGQLSIDTSKLGEGPLVLRAVGYTHDTPPARVLSRPIYVDIEPQTSPKR
jgi:hypothetical protein